MTLYHNADICNLESILERGILSADVVGSDWEEGNRGKNATDCVYLHNAPDNRSFVQYGAALIEVECDDAIESEMAENDANRGLYTEYIVKEIKPEQIKHIFVPAIFDVELPEDSRIVRCEMEAEIYYNKTLDTNRPWETVLVHSEQANGEELRMFAKSAKVISTHKDNYFRGVDEYRRIIDVYNVKYIR